MGLLYILVKKEREMLQFMELAGQNQVYMTLTGQDDLDRKL